MNAAAVCENVALVIGNLFAFSDLGMEPARDDDGAPYVSSVDGKYWNIELQSTSVSEFGERLQITVRVPKREGIELLPEELN